ncbi:MAG: KilA-N domain-containing protein [Bacteroidota bacterium]
MAGKKQKMIVQNLEISIVNRIKNQYISLTDIARYRNQMNPTAVISNWIRATSTLCYLGLWEKLNNSIFKPLEFEGFKNESGNNYFVLSPQKWVKETNAIGIISKSGRYGGTFAHMDIAFEFASWISPEFKLYLITEFQRLKAEENTNKHLEWNLQRTLAKINYRIHTDAIQQTIVPSTLSAVQKSYIYADEADLLNVAMFGKTAKQWREENTSLKGNIRDHASLEQLIILSNMESINALLVRQNLPQSERLVKLNEVAILQMTSLLNSQLLKNLSQ